MTTLTAPSVSSPKLAPAIDAALSRIPPLWPLKHFVAVNPFVGLLDRPFSEACALLQRGVGAAPLQSPADYLAAYRSGSIGPDDLHAASDSTWPTARLIAALECPDNFGVVPPLFTVADLLDQERPRAHWSVFVVEEIAKYCAVTFDENQTTWNSPWKTQGLYASWRDAAQHDRNPESFGLAGFRYLKAGAVHAHLLRLAPEGTA